MKCYSSFFLQPKVSNTSLLEIVIFQQGRILSHTAVTVFDHKIEKHTEWGPQDTLIQHYINGKSHNVNC